MEPFRITLVSGDPAVREAAARAFDSAPHQWSLALLEHPPNPKNAAELGRVVWGPDVDAPDGAPRFDPDDPASLAGLAPSANAPTDGTVFTVSSVAGGAGVSTVALHLARSFTGLRRSTLLVETDPRGWLTDRLKLPSNARSAAAADTTEGSLALSCLPVGGGFKVLLAGLSPEPLGLVRRAGKIFDRIVLDIPADRLYIGIDDGDRQPLVDSDCITGGVLVLPPHRTAVRRAARFIETTHACPWAIVCNRLGSGGALTPQLLAKELGRAVDVGLPATPALRDTEDRATLLPARYRWARGVARVASALDRMET